MRMLRWMLPVVAAGMLAGQAAMAQTEVPAPGQSPKIDAIKERGVLRVAAIGEFPTRPKCRSWRPARPTSASRPWR
jgi:hypothetical protein